MREGGTIPLPPKICQGEESCRHAIFQTVEVVHTGKTSPYNLVQMLCAWSLYYEGGASCHLQFLDTSAVHR